MMQSKPGAGTDRTPRPIPAGSRPRPGRTLETVFELARHRALGWDRRRALELLLEGHRLGHPQPHPAQLFVVHAGHHALVHFVGGDLEAVDGHGELGRQPVGQRRGDRVGVSQARHARRTARSKMTRDEVAGGDAFQDSKTQADYEESDAIALRQRATREANFLEDFR